MTPWTRPEMAARLARDIPPGAFVNLGIGMPSLVAHHLPPANGVVLHSENGVLNFGGPPPPGAADPDLVDAGKNPVSLQPGASFFDSALSFGIMRGGHLDIAVLGGFEVSATGDLANWWTGQPDDAPAVGGAMDLASGARQIWVLMEHRTKTGQPRVVGRCTYPLTARAVVTRLYTDLAVLAPGPAGLRVLDRAPGLTHDALQALTAAPLANPQPAA